MNKNRSQFDFYVIVIGFILGVLTVAFNASAYVSYDGNDILHPYVTLGAGLILGAIGMISHKCTKGPVGINFLSFVGGIMLGIIAVGFYYHWGFGILSLTLSFSLYWLRKIGQSQPNF
jgi:hypothetical protein